MATTSLPGGGLAVPAGPAATSLAARRGDPARGGLPALLAGDRRGLFWRLVGNGALQAAATLAIPLSVQQLATSEAQLPLLLALAVAAGLLVLLRIVELVDAERLGQRYVTEVRMDLLDAVLDGRSRSSHGVTMTRLLNDLTALKNWVGLGLARSAVAAIALFGCLLAAVLLDGGLALVVLVPIAGVSLIAALTIGPLRRRVGTVRRERGRLANRLGTVLLSLELVRAFASGPRHRARIVAASHRLTTALEARMWPTGLLRALPQLVLPSVIVLAAVLPTGTSGGDILVAVLLAGLAAGPLATAARALEYHAAYAVARQRLTPALSEPSAAAAADGPLPTWPEAASPGRPTACRVPIEPWLAPPRSAAAAWVVVSDRQTLPAGTLASVIDVTGRFRKSQRRLERVVRACALTDAATFPQGLETPIAEAAAGLSRSLAARLRLARAAALQTGALVVDEPMVVIDAACRRAVERLAQELDLAVLIAWPATIPVPDGWAVAPT